MYDKICSGQSFTNMFPSNKNLFRKYFHKGCGYEQMHLKRNAIYNNVLANL